MRHNTFCASCCCFLCCCFGCGCSLPFYSFLFSANGVRFIYFVFCRFRCAIFTNHPCYIGFYFYSSCRNAHLKSHQTNWCIRIKRAHFCAFASFRFANGICRMLRWESLVLWSVPRWIRWVSHEYALEMSLELCAYTCVYLLMWNASYSSFFTQQHNTHTRLLTTAHSVQRWERFHFHFFLSFFLLPFGFGFAELDKTGFIEMQMFNFMLCFFFFW